ncbi:RyR domain-containing protein [Enorma phocaeensis]|uniref:RyR domain-containing protein n=1 Tax=Enorma phocaeensis TaxID=1871019 RepID=UPI000C83FD48|nr:RyR domain-containing protein [Enorma phocaeensis]
MDGYEHTPAITGNDVEFPAPGTAPSRPGMLRTETATADEAPFAPEGTAGAPRFATVAGVFDASSPHPMVSSTRKHVYRGILTRPDGVHLQAVAVLFQPGDVSFYAAEVASLARNRLLCVGPEVHDLVATVEVAGRTVPCILEEDAGVNLEQAIFSGAPLSDARGATAAPLNPVGSPERAAENAKILYDILDQVERLHAHGLYHRDVRAANICVRRFGPAPADIHASLIDHELVTDYAGSDIPASAERYSRTLFQDIPRAIEPGARPCRPTSLMRDLGYLAALRFELEHGRGVEEASAAELTFGRRPFFQYTEAGAPVIRRLDRAEDLDPLARSLGLTPLDADHFFDARLVGYALERVAPGGFIDARGRAILARDVSFLDEAPIDAIARDATYQAWLEECRRAGRTPEYASFDEQPETLKASNVDQVRDIPAKVHALGYRIVRADDPAAAARIRAFSPEEIESLAFLEHRRWCAERLRNGWVAGSPRDDERRIHPDLVPYDLLSEQSREYDRVAARTVLAILEHAGFAVVR